MNKKGNVLDITVVMFILFVAAIAFFVVFMFLAKFQTAATPLGLNTTVINQGVNAVKGFDIGFGTLLVGLFAAVIVSAFYIKTHPVFFAVTLVALIVSIFIAIVFGNMFLSFANATPETTNAGNNFPLIINIFQNFPLIAVVLGFVVLIALFAKRKSNDIVGG